MLGTVIQKSKLNKTILFGSKSYYPSNWNDSFIKCNETMHLNENLRSKGIKYKKIKVIDLDRQEDDTTIEQRSKRLFWGNPKCDKVIFTYQIIF